MLWNVYSFFVTYARIDGFDPPADGGRWPSAALLDRWILSRFQARGRTGREQRAPGLNPAEASRLVERLRGRS